MHAFRSFFEDPAWGIRGAGAEVSAQVAVVMEGLLKGIAGVTGYFLLIHIVPWSYYEVTRPRYSS